MRASNYWFAAIRPIRTQCTQDHQTDLQINNYLVMSLSSVYLLSSLVQSFDLRCLSRFINANLRRRNCLDDLYGLSRFNISQKRCYKLEIPAARPRLDKTYLPSISWYLVERSFRRKRILGGLFLTFIVSLFVKQNNTLLLQGLFF